MNLDKISEDLCFAFQQSEGPFNICIEYEDKKEWSKLSRNEIKIISDNDAVQLISLDSLNDERRSSFSLWLRDDPSNRRKIKRV